MSSPARATAIGMLGPAISLVGLIWMLLDALFNPTPEAANFRYFLFDSPHLVIAVGTVVSAICLPISLQVARAQPEELELPNFEAKLAEEPLEGEGAASAKESDGSYPWSPK